MFSGTSIVMILAAVAVVVAVGVFIAITFRKVVAPNEVHIVQAAKKTTSYGKGKTSNVYYKFPSSIPVWGVSVVSLPVSVFDLSFDNYKAYDTDKVPFVVDITAFFRIADPEVAAERVERFEELKDQLRAVVQGAVRTTLAKSDIEKIMLDRAVFGAQFTKEVQEELKAWGVETVKSIELMDIRDTDSSKVIDNIQKKKKSNIEMESRKEVAKNNREAEMAEIEAQKEIDMESEKARELVGQKRVEADRIVALAEEKKMQELKEEQKLTKEKDMAVLKVERVREAEISKETALVKESEEKETRIIQAEADLAVQEKQKESEVVRSEGLLTAKENEAKGIEAEGKAKAEAQKEMEMAPITAQIALAKEIGENEGYQKYLISVKGIEAEERVGMEKAKALTKADVKVIANAESPTGGIDKAMDLFSSKGGMSLGTMLEGFKNTDAGKRVTEAILGEENPKVIPTATVEEPSED